MKRKFFLLVAAIWVFSTACLSSATQTKPTITAPSPTVTPTVYFVRLPTSIQSTSGWKITLSAMDLQTALGETKPEKKMFLVALVEIENLSDKSDCIKSDQFSLQNKLQKIEMERAALEAGKSAYSRDYPGTILGQCLSANEKKESLLVFDIPDTSEELSLNFQDQKILLGKIEAIRNPLPTLTPTITATVAPTATFTITFTPKPTVPPSETPKPKATATPLATSAEEATWSALMETVSAEATARANPEVLTAQNNADMAKLLKAGYADPFIGEFAIKYAGRIIQFDGYIAHIAPYENFKTRFDFLIYTGNNGGSSGNALAFKVENVSYLELKLTGSNIPDTVRVGQNVRITAKVVEHKAASGIFFLTPVSTEIR